MRTRVKREAEEDWGIEQVDMKRGHAAVVAVAIGALSLALPADARPNKQKRSKVQKQYELQTQTPSDGRILRIRLSSI